MKKAVIRKCLEKAASIGLVFCMCMGLSHPVLAEADDMLLEIVPGKSEDASDLEKESDVIGGNDSFETALPYTMETELSTPHMGEKQELYYTFTLDESAIIHMVVSFSATHKGYGHNTPKFSVYDETGELLHQIATGDFEEGINKTYIALLKGKYYISIFTPGAFFENDGWAGTATVELTTQDKSKYSQTIVEDYSDSDTRNDTKGTASEVEAGKKYYGILGVNNSIDWYKFTLGSKGMVRATGKYFGKENVSLFTVYDSSMENKYMDSYVTAGETYETDELDPGTYYFVCTRNDISNRFAYEFTITGANGSKDSQVDPQIDPQVDPESPELVAAIEENKGALSDTIGLIPDNSKKKMTYTVSPSQNSVITVIKGAKFTITGATPKEFSSNDKAVKVNKKGVVSAKKAAKKAAISFLPTGAKANKTLYVNVIEPTLTATKASGGAVSKLKLSVPVNGVVDATLNVPINSQKGTVKGNTSAVKNLKTQITSEGLHITGTAAEAGKITIPVTVTGKTVKVKINVSSEKSSK